MIVICVGNNQGLKGAMNDAIIAFNYFAKYEDVKSVILKTIDLDEMRKVTSANNDETVIYYHAGHYNNGILSSDLINALTNKKMRNIIVIIDSCKSGLFAKSIKHPFVNKYLIITSCKGTQNCSESLSDKIYDELKRDISFVKNKNFYVGIFTYNLFTLLSNGNDLKKMIDSKVWKTIEFVGNQTITIYGDIELFP